MLLEKNAYLSRRCHAQQSYKFPIVPTQQQATNKKHRYGSYEK